MTVSQKINYIISIFTGVLSAIFGEFWFLFAFLLGLNVIDYITGILKAKHLKIESSKRAAKGFLKKFLIWCLIAMGFGLSICFIKIGHILNVNLKIMTCIGFIILIHCIINEFRSILENIVELDKGYLVPKWLIKGFEIASKTVDKKANEVIDKLDNDKK